jgi:hypothetical protein
MISIDDYDRYIPDYLGIGKAISDWEKEHCRRERRARRETPPDELGGPEPCLELDLSATVPADR